MGAQKPTALRRYIYQGDPLLAPPPQELAAILERYRGQPDALITVLEEMQDHYGYLPRQGLQYTARAWAFRSAGFTGSRRSTTCSSLARLDATWCVSARARPVT